LGYTDVELSILIVDDQEMAGMNLQYRRIDSTTDVLSFPMWEGDFGDVCMDLLGDVVISAPTAQRMAVEHRIPLSAVLDLLLVHGILHLVGYDHERGEEAAREMEDRSMDLLHLLGHAKESFDWYLKPAEGPVQTS
jgi:probable rRNA maturation factor